MRLSCFLHPEVHELNSIAAFNNPGTESMMRQMIENPQQAMNIMQAPYVQSIMNFMAANPNVMQQVGTCLQ